MKKLVLFAAVVSLSGRASASFDLMYIPVRAENRVARYDPVNRVLLGSFHAPGATRVVSGNERYGMIQTSAGAYRFDMFTGSQIGFLGSAILNGSYDRVNARGVRVSTGSVVNQNFVSGASSTVILGAAAAGTGLATNVFSNGAYGYVSNASGNLRSSFHTSTGAFISTGATAALTIFSPQTSNSVQWRNLQGADVISSVILDATVSQFRLMHLSRSSTNAYSISFGGYLSNFATNQPVSLAPAHNGYYVVGADAMSPGSLTRITQYDDDAQGFLYDSWTVGLNVSGNAGFGVGMVLAPEPGTMIALGAGVLALLRKRTKKA